MNEREKIANISIDCVIFGYEEGELKVLLRKEFIECNGVMQERYKLPGNHMFVDERIEDTASRILKEQTGAINIFLQQFKVFSDLDRLSRDADEYRWVKRNGLSSERVITVGFYSLVKLDDMKSQKIVEQAKWTNVNEVKELIFDHNTVLEAAKKQLKIDISISPVVFELLPKKFTLSQLQLVMEKILNTAYDKRNFRRKIAVSMPYVVPLNEKQKGVSHKPASFYAFDKRIYKTTQNNLK